LSGVPSCAVTPTGGCQRGKDDVEVVGLKVAFIERELSTKHSSPLTALRPRQPGDP